MSRCTSYLCYLYINIIIYISVVSPSFSLAHQHFRRDTLETPQYLSCLIPPRNPRLIRHIELCPSFILLDYPRLSRNIPDNLRLSRMSKTISEVNPERKVKLDSLNYELISVNSANSVLADMKSGGKIGSQSILPLYQFSMSCLVSLNGGNIQQRS